jgi:hypothetical protein
MAAVQAVAVEIAPAVVAAVQAAVTAAKPSTAGNPTNGLLHAQASRRPLAILQALMWQVGDSPAGDQSQQYDFCRRLT